MSRALAHLAAYGMPLDSATARKISVGLEGTIIRLQEEVFPFLSAGGSEIQFVYGANGRGKTHYLMTVEAEARQNNFVTARMDCPAGKSPFASWRDTYQLVAASMSVGSVFGQKDHIGIPAVIRAAVGEGDPTAAKQIVAILKSSKVLAPDFRNVVRAYVNGVQEGFDSNFMESAIESLLLGSQTSSVRIGDLYKQDRSLPRPLGKLTARNAAVWTRSLFSLSVALGYEGCVIMFDETERAFHNMRSRAVQEQLAHLRNLVDYCALGAFSGCSIYYSASEDFIDFARENLEALAQRIEPPPLLSELVGSNVRSAWTDLDDLTSPASHDPKFFRELGEKIIHLGVEAGLSEARAAKLRAALSTKSVEYARSPLVVRRFVKETASIVSKEVKSRG